MTDALLQHMERMLDFGAHAHRGFLAFLNLAQVATWNGKKGHANSNARLSRIMRVAENHVLGLGSDEPLQPPSYPKSGPCWLQAHSAMLRNIVAQRVDIIYTHI